MGQAFWYKCTSCTYEVETSGKKDRGMKYVVKPYICNDCKIITDVIIGELGIEYLKEEIPEGDVEYYKCSECGGENITAWNLSKKPCPKCGSKMIKDLDGSSIMWD